MLKTISIVMIFPVVILVNLIGCNMTTTNELVEKAAAIQQKYWTPNPDEKKLLLQKNIDDLGWEQVLRLLHLSCLEMLSDGICKKQFTGDSDSWEAPPGDNRELILQLIGRLNSEDSPYRPRSMNVWQGEYDDSNRRNSDLQGELRNMSLTHLGSIEVIRLDDKQQPVEIAFIPFNNLRSVVFDRPAFFRFAKLTFNDSRSDEDVLVPLLYGISWFSQKATDKDGSTTRFICGIQPKEDELAFSIGVGHQDFFIKSGNNQTMFGLGSIGKFSVIHPE